MEPFHRECSVSGRIGYVLFASSLTGSAPLAFERVLHGWKIKVSRAAHVYGIIYAVILSVTTSASLCAGLVLYPRTLLARSWLDDVVAGVHLAITLPVALLGALTGANRMRHLVHNLAEIQKINEEMNKYHKQDKPADMHSFLFMVLHYYAIVFINIGLFIYEFIIDYDYGAWLWWDVSSHLLVASTHALVLQFHLAACAVLASFRHLNICLRSLVDNILDDSLDAEFNFHDETSYYDAADEGRARAGRSRRTSRRATLRRLAELYGELCDVVRSLQRSYGLVLVQITITSLLCCTSSNYHACRIAFVSPPWKLYKALPDFMWVWLYAGNIKCLCDPCHFTYVEVNMTKRLIARLLRRAPAATAAAGAELQLFYRQLALNDLTYSPLGMFTLGRKLINTVLGIVTGFTVILLESSSSSR